MRIFKFYYKYSFSIVSFVTFIGICLSVLFSYLELNFLSNLILALFIFIASILYVKLNDSHLEKYGDYKTIVDFYRSIYISLKISESSNLAKMTSKSIGDFLDANKTNKLLELKVITKTKLEKLNDLVNEFIEKTIKLIESNKLDSSLIFFEENLGTNRAKYYCNVMEQFGNERDLEKTEIMAVYKVGKRYRRLLKKYLNNLEKDILYFEYKFKSEIYRDIKLEEELDQVNKHVVKKIKAIEEVLYDTTQSLSNGIEEMVTDSLSKTLDIIDRIIEDRFGDIDSRMDDIDTRMDDIEEITSSVSNTYTIDDVFNSLEQKRKDHIILDGKLSDLLEFMRDVQADVSDLDSTVTAEFEGLIQQYLDETKDDIEQSVIMLLRELRDHIETEIDKLKK